MDWTLSVSRTTGGNAVAHGEQECEAIHESSDDKCRYNARHDVSRRRPASLVRYSQVCRYRAGPLVPLVMSFLRLSNTRDLVPSRIRSAHQLEKFLKGLLVIIKRNPTNETRPKRIVGLLMTGARDHRFTDKNGDNVSVAVRGALARQCHAYRLQGHYTRTYSRPITLPDIICVLVGTRDSVVPLEVCEVIGGQPYKGTLPPEATSRAVRVGSTRPGPRLSAIRQAHAVRRSVLVHLQVSDVLSQDLQYGQSQFIRSLGMTIDTNPLELQGRIKEPPVVFFGRDQQVAVSVRFFV